MLHHGDQSAKSARLDLRISPELKRRTEKAAALQSKSLSDFVADAIASAADRTLNNHEVMVLREKNAEIFFSALENPPAPNESLRSAIANYRNWNSGL